jgi:hypothetical protein
MKCKVCLNNEDNTLFIFREMMLGLREDFDYILCNKCGCLQIVEVPKNMQKYYPYNYYSYLKSHKKASFLKKIIIK